MPTIRAALLLAAAGACATATFAQPIWRCGSSYSDQPCADGKALADTPATTRADQAQAASAAARDARLADSLEKDRLRLESQAAPAVLPPPRLDPPPEKHKWPEQAGTRKLDVFTATAPGSRPPKGKDKAHAKSHADAGSKGKKDGKKDVKKPPAIDGKAPPAPKAPGLASAAPARP